MRRIVQAIINVNGTRFQYGPAAMVICKYCMLLSLMCLLSGSKHKIQRSPVWMICFCYLILDRNAMTLNLDHSNWLNDCLSDWLTEWRTDWLTEWMNEWMNEWRTDWLNDWLTAWLIDWLTEFMTDWLTDRLIDWPIWPIDLFTYWFT